MNDIHKLTDSNKARTLLPKRGVLTQIIPSKRTFYVDTKEVIIGSAESTDVCLYSELISPIHAVIEWDGLTGQARVFDFGSTSGLKVNGKSTQVATLEPMDHIIVGPYEFQWSTSEGENPEVRLLELNQNSVKTPKAFSDFATGYALEIVHTWQGSIRSVNHFSHKTSFTLGSDHQADLLCPVAVKSGLRFELARKMEGDKYKVFIPPQAFAQGYLHGVYLQIKPEVREVLLERGDFLKIVLGHFEFYLRVTEAPRKLLGAPIWERDPFLLRLQVVSLLVMIGAIVGSFYLDPPQTTEVEDVPERVAAIVYQPLPMLPPEKKERPKREDATNTETSAQIKPPPVANIKIDVKASDKSTDKVPTKMQVGSQGKLAGAKQVAPGKQGEAKEGAGARAKGAEGTRGEKNAPKSKLVQTKAKRTSSEGGEGLGGGASQVEDQGNVDLLKSAAAEIQGLLGNTSARLGKGGSELQGFGNFSTLGKGGAALSGSGKGGGGDAETIGGLAKTGRGGGRVGTGLGAAGAGAGIVGGQSRVALRLGGEGEAVVVGSIDKGAIAAAIEAHRDEFRACYEREINAETPNLRGTIKTSFVIGSSGRVGTAGVENSTLDNIEVQRCVIAVLKRIQFPIPEGAGQVTVTYPFKFSSGSGK